MWLAVASAHAESAGAALEAYWDLGLTEEERLAAHTVVDHDADEIVCPGCQTRFASGPDRCPDCGLFLG